MKRFLMLILTLLMLLCFSSCREQGNVSQENQSIREDSTGGSESSTKVETSNELTDEEIVEKYFEAFAALDYDTLFDLCVDPNAINTAVNSGECADENDFRTKFKADFSKVYEDEINALGENRSVTHFEVIESRDIPKDQWGEIGYADDIQNIRVITAEITISGDIDELSSSGNTPLYQLDDKWYIGTYRLPMGGKREAEASH